MENTEIAVCRGSRESLLKFLLVKTAPVMLKVRPAILVRLTNCSRVAELRRYDQFCIYQQEIIAALQLEHLALKSDDRDIQLMFFDREEMSRLLKQVSIRDYLTRCGYRDATCVDEYLNELRHRFSGADFPHEIGLFLGYPLNDVRGFMEKRVDVIKMPHALWRIFDDPAESLRRMWMFRFAEDIGRAAISQYNDIDNSIAQIRKAVCDKKVSSSV